MMRNILLEIHRCSADRAIRLNVSWRQRSPRALTPIILSKTIVYFSLNSYVRASQLPTMAPTPSDSAKIEEAKKLGKTDPLKAEAIYKEILSKKPGASEVALREYESALMGLGETYRDTRKTNELAELVKSSTSSLSSFTKAKTAKLGIEIQPIHNHLLC